MNGIYNPVKRQRLSDWIRNNTQLCGVYRKHITVKDTNRLKVKGWKQIYYATRNQKKPALPILISDKIDIKTNNVTGL